MNPETQTQIEGYQYALRDLIGRGSQLRDRVLVNPGDSSAIPNVRAWQEECGQIINQLSGGSKAHWLARLFSEAFLMRSVDGAAMESVPPGEIMQRLLDVLNQAGVALSQLDSVADHDGHANPATEASAAPRRFDFVHNRDLRLVLEQAYIESRRTLDESDFGRSLLVSAGILETIITDAVQHFLATSSGEVSAGDVVNWTFRKRLEAAEHAGLIRAGWMRLPTIAQNYREQSESEVAELTTEREARQCLQVLNVVMRDLNPGR